MELDRSDIEQILELIDSSSYDVISIEWKGLKISLKRGADGVLSLDDQTVLPSHLEKNITSNVSGKKPSNYMDYSAQEDISEVEKALKSNTKQDVSESSYSVKSPTVGIFYRRPNPDAPPFVEKGTIVNEGDTLCLIEVMKVFTAITAPKTGKIDSILVDDSSLVEHDQDLFLIADDVV